MALIRLNTNPTQAELRWFAGLWVPIFGVVAGAVALRFSAGFAVAASILGIALAVGIAGLWSTRVARCLFINSMYATYPLGWVMSYVILGVVYFLVITPIGITMRVFGWDPLGRRCDSSGETFWTAHRGPDRISRYFRQF